MSIPLQWQSWLNARAVTLDVSHVCIDDVEEVLAILAEAAEGWVCTTDRAQPLGGSLPLGAPLSAEWVVSKVSSVHLRQHGARWMLWTYVDNIGTGDELAFDDSFISTEMAATGEGRRKLSYRTYWRRDHAPDELHSVRVWRPYAARFLGWEK